MPNLERFFNEGFTAADIAEPLVSFDAEKPAEDALALMDLREFDYVGVRIDGEIAGFIQRESLGEGSCGDYLKDFEDAVITTESCPLAVLISNLQEKGVCFIKTFGKVNGIITVSDLHKPPVRMWVFGMITIIEMSFSQAIKRQYPRDKWKQYLSEARFEKAQELLKERARRNQALGLVDCLQFADKGQIVARSSALREQFDLPSRKMADRLIKELQKLRNNLAHSQDIISSSFDIIAGLSENLETIMSLQEKINASGR